MSWKGFSRGAMRAPQQFRQKFNLGDITKDAFFIDAELRFTEMEKETAALHDESTKYFNAIHGMLDHQIDFAKACEEIYKPISGRASDLSSFVDDVGNPEGIQACEEYVALVNDLKASLAPELEMIKTRIVVPAEELMVVVKQVRDLCTKRDHKQLDYDRKKNTLKKLQDKPDKSAKDESALYKAENEFEEARFSYEDFNNGLKDHDNGLPRLFELQRDFIAPLFQSFYYMQLNVFYTLHEHMQAMHIDYFNFNLEIEEGFQEKRADIQAITEKIPIVKFKTTGGRRPPSKFQSRLAIENGRTSSTSSAGSSRPLRLTQGHEDDASSPSSPPPPYQTNGDIGRSASTGSNLAIAAKSKAAPPPPKPKPGRLSGVALETVTALYDYEAQAEGDLSFSAGDVVEIVQRTDNTNEWWVGKVAGRQGQFPANYVQLNS